MQLAPEPEIMRCSLTSSILQLKCLNQDLEELDLMDMPDLESGEHSVPAFFIFFFPQGLNTVIIFSLVRFKSAMAPGCHKHQKGTDATRS